MRRHPTTFRALLLLFVVLWCTRAFGSQTNKATDANETVIEGTLTQVSTLPPAASNPYPDCYYTAIVEIHHILSGKSIPQRIILVLPGFFGRQYAPEAKYQQGDKVSATIVPFSSMPDNVRQTQQADEIDSIDLDFYFPKRIQLIDHFGSEESGPSILQKEITVNVPLANPQRTDLKADALRQAQLKHDLEEINTLLKKHGGDWQKWYESLQPFRTLYQKQYDRKAARWVGNSFFSAGHIDNGHIYHKDFVNSLVQFKNYLAARKVDLIVVRVPYEGEIVDDLFVDSPPADVPNPYLLRLYKELLESDVEVITDIIPRAKKARKNYPLMYWYQDFAEHHPAEGMAWTIAEAFSDRLKRYDRITNAAKEILALSRTSTGTDISADSHVFHWPEGSSRFNPRDYVTFSSVVTMDGKIVRPTQSTNSPVLVVGSSFIEYPSLRLGGNIPSYLAYKTGIVPDILYRSGSGAGIPRAIAREKEEFLQNRVVCLFPIQPWVLLDPLSAPPIIDVAKFTKVLLASYTAVDLQKQTQLPAKTPDGAFTYSPDGIIIKPINKDTRAGGSLLLKLPSNTTDYPAIMIEVESRIGDAAIIKASYGKQTDIVHKSYSQNNSSDFFVFRTYPEYDLNFRFSNIRLEIPTILKGLRIYGLRP